MSRSTSKTWNKRYREYLEKIKTGSVYEIAKVLRDLLISRTTKTCPLGNAR
jgi:CarD family transcriptional regulator